MTQTSKKETHWPRIILHGDMDAFYAAVEQLDHPELRPDRLSLDGLLRYRVLVAPSVEALSDRHARLLGEYLRRGGTLLVLGKLGVRDEMYDYGWIADANTRQAKVSR